MKPFHFKKFSINQSKDVFRVGTDGVLLGAMCSVENATNILEVGTGTGLISLMIAQRNPKANILAIDIDENAVKLAEENFTNTIFSERLNVLNKDFKNFSGEEKFDFIVSNPPYFEENLSEKDVVARQRKELKFEDLVEKASENLSENGIFAVIIPFESSEHFEKICSKNNLSLHRKVVVLGIQNSNPKRVILEFGFKEKKAIESEFTIEKSPRKYTGEYLELTKDFHVFKKEH